MSLPCSIEGLPLLHLTHVEERVLRLLVDGGVHTSAEVKHAIWKHWPPDRVEQCLVSAIRHTKGKVMPHGYLLIHEPRVGYSLIKDTRKFA